MASHGGSNVKELVLTYDLESLGSGATATLKKSEGNANDLGGIMNAVHPDSNSLQLAGGLDIVSDAQLDQGRQSLQGFQVAPSNGFATEIQFGFPVRSKYALSEAQKMQIYRKTVELCRMIRHKLARTMSVNIECNFPAPGF